MNKKIKVEGKLILHQEQEYKMILGDLPPAEPYKKKWNNVLMLPLVRTLVFDPSKEFKGNPRK